jgi:seryl-tRNA synthetase
MSRTAEEIGRQAVNRALANRVDELIRERNERDELIADLRNEIDLLKAQLCSETFAKMTADLEAKLEASQELAADLARQLHALKGASCKPS